jgi:hypothetical protein
MTCDQMNLKKKTNRVITIVRYFVIGMKAMHVIFIYLFICKDDAFFVFGK